MTAVSTYSCSQKHGSRYLLKVVGAKFWQKDFLSESLFILFYISARKSIHFILYFHHAIHSFYFIFPSDNPFILFYISVRKSIHFILYFVAESQFTLLSICARKLIHPIHCFCQKQRINEQKILKRKHRKISQKQILFLIFGGGKSPPGPT